MAWWIEVIKPVGQHPHSRESIGQSLPVCVDVYAVGQPAYDEHLGAKCPQVGHETAYEVLSVGRAVACSHDVDHPLRVKVGVAEVEKYERCIGTLLQALRIARVVERQRLDVVLKVVGQFRLSLFQRFVETGQRVDEPVAGIGQYVTNVVAVGYHFRGRPEQTVEFEQPGKREVVDARQGDGVDDFLLVQELCCD